MCFTENFLVYMNLISGFLPRVETINTPQNPYTFRALRSRGLPGKVKTKAVAVSHLVSSKCRRCLAAGQVGVAGKLQVPHHIDVDQNRPKSVK